MRRVQTCVLWNIIPLFTCSSVLWINIWYKFRQMLPVVCTWTSPRLACVRPCFVSQHIIVFIKNPKLLSSSERFESRILRHFASQRTTVTSVTDTKSIFNLKNVIKNLWKADKLSPSVRLSGLSHGGKKENLAQLSGCNQRPLFHVVELIFKSAAGSN